MDQIINLMNIVTKIVLFTDVHDFKISRNSSQHAQVNPTGPHW